MSNQAGKGDKIRKGANLKAYWDNFPLEEKNTASYWGCKMGYNILDHKGFRDMKPGDKLTEYEFMKRLEKGVEKLPEISQQEIDELHNCMNSISYSEFQKIAHRKH